ncbi:MAG: ChaN family lipoprotein [Flavobacteriales bacterium]|jgi:uncharacterized iron-regulated protein|nr:ChaN family lipoprotein [Flavobacteriales bacterium]
MKKIFLLSFLLFSLNFALAGHRHSYVLYNAKGKKADLHKIVKKTEDKQYVFFGEYHDNPISHWLQFELTKEMYAMHKRHLVLGAEMFEADNQFILDEYLEGLISPKNFQDEVRLWPNYSTDYKPLIEFAKQNKLPFIATNVPRRYANMVYKKGFESLKDLSDLAKSYIVPLDQFEFDSTVTCYKDLLRGFAHGGINMATAQALKDATMAHFILKNSDSKSVFLHYNGAYHSDNYQGIVHYLKKNVDEDKIMTITTVSQENVHELDEKNKGIADYIVCVSETMTSTH